MNLSPKQEQARDLLNSDAKHILLDGGSRSGKTRVICRNIILRAIKAPKSRHGILRLHFKDVKESIGMDTMPNVFQSAFPDIEYALNKSEWVFTLPKNGAEIWLAGMDDKERTEKVLGKEFATLYANECSQLSWHARNMALTRLSQVCSYQYNGSTHELARKFYYDCNPPSKAHWCYQVFYQQRDPETKRVILDQHNYAKMTLNPRDNPYLPADYIKELENQSGRMRRRFWEGQYGDVAAGALWSEELIDKWRVTNGDMADLQRVVVAVDPSGSGDSDNSENDEIGIMVGGIGTDGIGYLLEDLTLKAGPATWGKVATTAYDRHDADAIVGEKNFGGEMVRYVMDSQPKVNGRRRNVKLVTASRGKSVRAEPISSLFEQGKIRLVGTFPRLEEELLSMTTNGYVGDTSPNRADAFVWLMSELFPGIVREAVKPPVQTNKFYLPMGAQGWQA